MTPFKIVVASTINGFNEAEEIVKEVTEKKDIQLIWHPDSDGLQKDILSLCGQEISECNCMLTVIGHRYSDFLPGKEVSLGHAQADFALAQALRPHLAFKLPSTQGTEPLPSKKHDARHRLVKDLQVNQVLNEPFDLDQFEKSLTRALTWLLIESRQARKIVLVSSTFADLKDARTELRTAVESSGIGMPCIMFEDLPKGLSAEDTSRRLAEQAGLYFGLLSDYRGTVIPGRSISYTELEYEAAYSLQRSPIVLFEAANPNLLGAHEQNAEDFRKTKEFNDLLRARHSPVRQFRRMSHLYRIAIDILYDLEQSGELKRGIHTNPRDATLEPQPPKPFFVQEYSLAVETNLIGRDGELRALDSWLSDSTAPHFGARIYCIDAAGGMGKSALARNWLDRLLASPKPHFEAVVWFSFYAVETGFDIMAESVLPYLLRLSGLDHIRDADLSSLEKMLRIVEERRILLVLDGLERRMKLYTTFRARGYEGRDLAELVKERVEYHRHLFLGEWPDEMARQLAEEDCYRMTEEEAEVLRRLARPGRSRVLMTSRFFPTDLQHRQTKPSDTKILPEVKDLDGVARLPLEPFDLAKARELAVALDLPWQQEFSALHGKVGGYPLYLSLAFAFAARGKDSPEEFRRRVGKIASALKGDAEEARKAVVTLGINDLSYQQQEILYEVESCPIATNFVGLRRVLCGPAALFNRPSELEANLQVLHAKKLLGWDRQTGTCDMHPVVRHAVRHFGDQPAINQRIIDRHGGDSKEALITLNEAMLNERLSEILLLFNAIMRKENYSEKSFLAYLVLDDWFRFNSSEIDKRLEYLEDFHRYEFKFTVPARIQLLTRLADTYLLKAQLVVAQGHAVRAFELASQSGDRSLIQVACLRCSSIASSQARCFDKDRFLRTAVQHDIFSTTGSYSTWLLCSQVAVSAAALRKEEASQILSYLQSNDPSHADVINAEFNLATALWPMDDQVKSTLEDILARFRRQCLSDNLVYGRFRSVVMSAELALLFGETPEYKKLIDNALSDVELTRFTALRLQLMAKRSRLATRRGLPQSALDEGRRARNDALQRGLSDIEAEACLAIAEAHFALNEREPAIHFATEAASLANAGGEPYCLRLLKNQIQKFFIEDLREPVPEFQAFPADKLTELPPMPPIPKPSSTVISISDTSGWSDERLESRYREVLDLIDWTNTTGSARLWWEAFERENAHHKALVLKLAEHLANSKATITEFFLAYTYANIDDIQGNLDYMHYSRLKKSEDARKKATQKGEPLPPLAFTPPQSEGSSKGISDSNGWTGEEILCRLAEVKESLDLPAATESARKWWDAFEKENTQRMALVLRLAEELLIRKATIQEFFLAYVYSNTDNILANLYYLDYTRRKKKEAQKKRQKEAAERLKALLPDLAPERKLPELTEKDLSILANLSDEDIPESLRERFNELLRTSRDRIHFQKEQEQADANRRLAELVPQLESSGPLPALTSEDVKVLRLATTDHLPESVVAKLRKAIENAFIADEKYDDIDDFLNQ
jgi:hypothetical protein